MDSGKLREAIDLLSKQLSDYPYSTVNTESVRTLIEAVESYLEMEETAEAAEAYLESISQKQSNPTMRNQHER